MVGGLRRQPVLAGHANLAIGVGPDQAGIDREAFAADGPFRDAAPNRRLEQFAQEITVAEAVKRRAVLPPDRRPILGLTQFRCR